MLFVYFINQSIAKVDQDKLSFQEYQQWAEKNQHIFDFVEILFHKYDDQQHNYKYWYSNFLPNHMYRAYDDKYQGRVPHLPEIPIPLPQFVIETENTKTRSEFSELITSKEQLQKVYHSLMLAANMYFLLPDHAWNFLFRFGMPFLTSYGIMICNYCSLLHFTVTDYKHFMKKQLKEVPLFSL